MKILGALFCAALFCGCTAQQVDTASNTVASAAPAVVNDALVVAQVEGYFVTIDADSALHTAVSSHGGIVHLSGRVKSAQVREKFIARAKTTPDVKGVESTLSVDPNVPSAQGQAGDFALTVAVEANLAAQTGINGLNIHVDSHAGAVTLTGPVDSAALHQTVLATAKKTSGVKSVVDKLTVKT